MSVLRVTQMGHPVLRQQAEPVPPQQVDDPQFQRFIDDMLETMVDYEGIGLAAPQVFQPWRLIVLGIPTAPGEEPGPVPLTVLINPEWVFQSEEQVDSWEGCLSIPGIRGVVPRSQQVRVRGLGRDGAPLEIEAADLYARVLQHEIDHLDGILFLDRMPDLQTLTFLSEHERYWQNETDDEEWEEEEEEEEAEGAEEAEE
jgi:peptide deformylase